MRQREVKQRKLFEGNNSVHVPRLQNEAEQQAIRELVNLLRTLPDQCSPGAIYPRGVLIGAAKGWFLARMNGTVTVNPVGNTDTGPVITVRDLPSGGVIVLAERG
jgi:hypothetical protein